MRTYELMFVVDPRVSDEEVVTMAQDYRNMITAGGSTITGEENWGRRKLAYPIDKVNEGKYFLFFVESEVGKTALPEVEHRMRQNDKILRYLTVRVDALEDEPSVQMQKKERDERRRRDRERRRDDDEE